MIVQCQVGLTADIGVAAYMVQRHEMRPHVTVIAAAMTN